MKKGTYKYQSYHGVVSNTVPGRCYSIGELLQRVLRGQPLPQVGAYEEDRRSYTDSEIEQVMDEDIKNPLFEPDSDIIEAAEAAETIDSHIEAVKAQKTKQTKKS